MFVKQQYYHSYQLDFAQNARRGENTPPPPHADAAGVKAVKQILATL
jgi:hypothetical protein